MQLHLDLLEPRSQPLRLLFVSTMQCESEIASASAEAKREIRQRRQTDPATSFDDFAGQPRSPWGFVAFLVAALGFATAIDRRAESPRRHVAAAVMPLPITTAAAESSRPQNTGEHAVSAEPKVDHVSPQNTVARAAKSRGSRNGIAFTSSSIVTTEGAVSAVFVLERSQPSEGRMRVRWSARSGTADAAIDFSDATGTAVLADGQARAAVYVRLRNDLLQEADETFKVCLDSSQQAGSGPLACAEATIRDDDNS
jgi:hypothetical protein